MLRAGLAASALCLPLVAGCGAVEEGDRDVAAAAERNAGAGSARIAIEGAMGEGRVTAEGVVDYDRRRTRLTIRTPGAEGEPDAAWEYIVVGDTFYVDAAMLSAYAGEEVVRGKRWLRFDLDDSEVSLDDLLFPFPFVDPGSLTATLRDAGGQVESLGSEQLRGVEAEGSRITVELARLIDRAPESRRAELREELAGEPEKTRSLEVWVDEDGFARRIGLESDDGPVTIDFYDFGVPAAVEVPPADEVASMEDGLGASGSGSGSAARL